MHKLSNDLFNKDYFKIKYFKNILLLEARKKQDFLKKLAIFKKFMILLYC